jgi:predicted  nucleic acid-binding Zn-ribbon protein
MDEDQLLNCKIRIDNLRCQIFAMMTMINELDKQIKKPKKKLRNALSESNLNNIND